MNAPLLKIIGRSAITLIGFALAMLPIGSRPVTAQAPSGPDLPFVASERALAFVQAADRGLNYVPGEVIVKFKKGVTVSGEQRALDALRSRPTVGQLRWVGDAAVWRDPSEWDATVLAAQLARQPEVAYAEPNYLAHFNSIPNDPGFSARQWNFSAIDMPRAWDINPGANSNTIVAVIDTGITAVNQSFSARTWNGTAIQTIVVPFAINPDLAGGRLVSPKNFVDGNPVLDMVGHGTHVSSTIGEDTNNNLAESGIAYAARIMPIKVCFGYWEVQFSFSAQGMRGYVPPNVGGCADDAIAGGIRYAADNGAKVINLSLGQSQPASILQDALNYAVGKGVFVAIAAGNEFEEGNPVEYPAAYAAAIDGVMAVGAVGRSLTRAFYSNTGSYIEIAAPGGNDRDGGLAGLIWQSQILPTDSDPATVIFPRFDRYIEWPHEGTSMASPHVAGIAALISSQGVTSPKAIEALIKRTAKDLGPGGRDDEFGYGLIQPRRALFGFGIAR